MAHTIVGTISDKLKIFSSKVETGQTKCFQKIIVFIRSNTVTDRLMQKNSDTETLHQRIAELLNDMPVEDIRRLISEIEENMIPKVGS